MRKSYLDGYEERREKNRAKGIQPLAVTIHWLFHSKDCVVGSDYCAGECKEKDV